VGDPKFDIDFEGEQLHYCAGIVEVQYGTANVAPKSVSGGFLSCSLFATSYIF
jgi:hypothetical protein